jgi:hypothetical protein
LPVVRLIGFGKKKLDLYGKIVTNLNGTCVQFYGTTVPRTREREHGWRGGGGRGSGRTKGGKRCVLFLPGHSYRRHCGPAQKAVCKYVLFWAYSHSLPTRSYHPGAAACQTSPVCPKTGS